MCWSTSSAMSVGLITLTSNTFTKIATFETQRTQ